MNNKGFTLIELLAVIVILGVLLAIAVPSVSKYINTAKKSTYVINVKEYADAAKKELNLIDSEFEYPVNYGEATIISFRKLKLAMENIPKKSPYGGEWLEDDSGIYIVNDGSAEKPHYTYYIQAEDSNGYGIGIVTGNYVFPCLVSYDNLSSRNIINLKNYDKQDISKLTEEEINEVDNSCGVSDQNNNPIDILITHAYTEKYNGVIECPTCVDDGY